VDRDDDRQRERKHAGQCADCCFARVTSSAKGSNFWRCMLAERDDAFLKYPPLPVASCGGFQAGR
jgi:hypothetical protein